MELSTIIKDYRKNNKLTMDELAFKVGVSKAYISMLEKNKNSTSGKPIKPSLETLKNLACAMHMTLDELINIMDDETIVSLNQSSPKKETVNFIPKGVQIPVLGYVIAGVPISAIEDIIDYEEISAEMAATGEYFGLKIKGKSMQPTFAEGDVIIVRQQPDVESNEIAVVLVNGDEGTVKRIKKSDNGITLIGDNVAAYSPHFYTNEEINQLPIKIIGKVVELRRSF